jgi:hypothetical protein
MGPNTFYNVVRVVLVGQQLEAGARNNPRPEWGEKFWWFVRVPGSTVHCWISSAAGRLDGDGRILPVESPPALPDAPADFLAVSTCPEKAPTRQVKLSWVGPPGVTGYVLYRRQEYDDEKPLASLAAETGSYTDVARPDHFYTYELAATNTYGASGRVGAWLGVCKGAAKP